MKSKEDILQDNLSKIRKGNTSQIQFCYNAIYATMEEYASQQAQESTPPVSARENGWVKVEDRLPENEDEVLVVHTEAGGISIAFYCDELKRWVPTDTDIERNGQILVTHWRPLPPPPSK